MADKFPGDRVIESEVEVLAVLFLEGGKTIGGYCRDGMIRLWDASSGALRQKVDSAGRGSIARALDRERGEFAKVTAEGKVQIWDLKTGKMERELAAAREKALDLAISRDGTAVATSYERDRQSRETLVRVFDATGRERFAAPAGLGGIAVLGFSPDGSAVVAGGWDTDLRVWNARNGELIRLIDSLPVAMFALSFSPDGELLATAGVDRTVYLWETKTWKVVRTLKGQQEMISAIGFSPDGRRLVTGGFSELTAQHPTSLLVWDLTSGRVLKTLPAPCRVQSAVFSPDGKLLAASYNRKAISVWGVPA